VRVRGVEYIEELVPNTTLFVVRVRGWEYIEELVVYVIVCFVRFWWRAI